MTEPVGPGWYPDPRHAGEDPAPERWWNGTDWTGHTRAAGEGIPGPVAAAPAAPPTPERLPAPPGDTVGGRGPLLIALTGAVLVLSALAAAAVLLLGGGSGDDERADGDRTPTATAPTTGTGDPGPRYPLTEGRARGVALPVLDGWEERPLGDGAATATSAGYPCPADDGQECRTAGAFLTTAEEHIPATPQEVAAADVAVGARESYNPEAYGGIASHTQVLADEVTIAGESGYRVRWRIVTEAGTEAYVESVAFPAPDDSGRMLVLRLGFDIGGDAPPVRDMDRIIQGVRPVSDAPGTDA
ncbi:DUF2510 domain-containing protein [Streptomyces sp. 6N223]|uniref:DUF2510 domain-containing protein n=1 Tax=Streptomyces sp. 6N223 TaxID=3457412 RepID=UPI003FD6692F